MRTARFGHGGAGIFLTVLCLASSGCSLILDFSEGGGSNADSGPDADLAPDGGGCATLEPNESLSAAMAITPGTLALGICTAGDRDFFETAVDGNQDLLVRIDFANAAGADLEMRLYDSLGAVVDRSETFEDFEQIEASLAMSNRLPAGTYFVEVFGFNNTNTNDYSLTLTITGP
jgi:hypothetical protein